MTLGEKIVYYRDKKGWTQKALAERMGITPTRLNYWEKDKTEVSSLNFENTQTNCTFASLEKTYPDKSD